MNESLCECPECAGVGWKFAPWGGDSASPEADECPVCQGTGKVPADG